MINNPRNIVIWCGVAPNQKALANKIAAAFPVRGIVLDERPGGGGKRNWRQLPTLLYDRVRFRKIYASWKKMMRYYDRKFPEWPDVPRVRVNGINSSETAIFTSRFDPDLVIVSGTALVKPPLLDLPAKIGIINLHTGLSPFVKGGPNCTNWCIANNTWHLVGNTIMWLNAGIDAGNIITTEAVDIRNAADLTSAHIRVMEHAHDLYLRAIHYLVENNPPYNSVPQQQLGKGQLFFNRMWTGSEKKRLLKNWKRRYSTGTSSETVATVPLSAYSTTEKKLNG